MQRHGESVQALELLTVMTQVICEFRRQDQTNPLVPSLHLYRQTRLQEELVATGETTSCQSPQFCLHPC